MENLMFSQSPQIVVATNTFIDVPIIIQYRETPLLEIVQEVNAGFTTKIPIFHEDGTKLATAKGTQLYLTADGEKAGLQLHHPSNRTICEISGRTPFEIERHGAAALKMSAELHTDDGSFVKWSDQEISSLLFGDPDQPLMIGGMMMRNCVIQGCRVGIQIN